MIISGLTQRSPPGLRLDHHPGFIRFLAASLFYLELLILLICFRLLRRG